MIQLVKQLVSKYNFMTHKIFFFLESLNPEDTTIMAITDLPITTDSYCMSSSFGTSTLRI